jgi:hypothetical protein
LIVVQLFLTAADVVFERNSAPADEGLMYNADNQNAGYAG